MQLFFYVLNQILLDEVTYNKYCIKYQNSVQ